jgi:hypothetical protein
MFKLLFKSITFKLMLICNVQVLAKLLDFIYACLERATINRSLPGS